MVKGVGRYNNQYVQTLRSLIDAPAPLKMRLGAWKPDGPLYTEPICEATRRRYENIR